MKRNTLQACGPGFWNIRGSFRIGGVVQIGTQASLVKLAGGQFTMLDSYALDSALLAQIEEITGGLNNISYVINTHPFHTVHTRAMHALLPNAVHIGTARHKRLFPDLTWDALCSEDPVLWVRFAPDLEFSVPGGVELIPANETIHCGSVLVYHRASGTLHVDDTFNFGMLGIGRKAARVAVHPTLKAALEKRPGAAQAFRDWGEWVLENWGDLSVLATAHDGVLTASALPPGKTMKGTLKAALGRSESVLAKHEKTFK